MGGKKGNLFSDEIATEAKKTYTVAPLIHFFISSFSTVHPLCLACYYIALVSSVETKIEIFRSL